MSGNEIVSIVALVMCLILAWGGLKSQALSAHTMLKMAAIWVAIFLAGVAVVSWMQG